MFSPRKAIPNSPRTVAPLNGLFKDGSWRCNCNDRPIAAKYEVKKEGRNKGRFFYTCQKKGCTFWLWADEAIPRESNMNTANTTNDADNGSQNGRACAGWLPSTPTKYIQPKITGLLTPQTERKAPSTPANNEFKKPLLSAKARMMAEDTDDFGWNDDSDENDELTNFLFKSQVELKENGPLFSPKTPSCLPETPSKAARTPQTTSPGKRKLSEFTEPGSFANSSAVKGSPARSLFSSTFPPSSIEMCQTPTPSKYRDVLSCDSHTDTSDLAEDAIAILEKHNVVLPNDARKDLVARLNKEKLKASGISRGRDLLREKSKKLELEITSLKETVVNLQAQHAMDQTLIDSRGT
ncbi:hypothetical protein N7495_003284 [Penicillium taxi]|uniref:uncharacterized protein n=1 Tax=Penicillium taxi TaxID=168475 RepID=UPI002544DAB8|nr:uncharacterized protein N7495_003284 [Penicillium taxi]KAJ5902756.1 hypothetical protein N7495_003284 [Penicillium taxi]